MIFLETDMENTKHNKEERLTANFKIFTAKVAGCMESKYTPIVAACVAAVLMLPALNAGFIQDDMFHRVRLVDPALLPPIFHEMGWIPPDAGTVTAAMRDMHSFSRTKEGVDKLKDVGMCPWWTAKDWQFANWRPLDSFTHWLDYRLFPNSPRLMHLHNILWFAAVVFLLTLLYRRFITPIGIASLAALLYIIDDNNYFPVMWIANRNLILALCFSILTLLLHHHWRENHSLFAGVAAPFTLLLSLLSTEAGIATFAYLFAYALIIDRESRMQRLASLAPSAIVIAVWRMIYNMLGYGAAGSGFVIDPGREPMRYARAVLERAPVLLSSQWGPTPAEMLNLFSAHIQEQYFLVTVAFLALLLIVLLPLLWHNRVARYWFVAMCLCVLPICATAPMNRNLLFVAIGAFGLMAQFLGGLFLKESWTARSRFWRVPAWLLCITLIFIHVGVAGVSRIKAPKTMSFAFDTFYSTIEIGQSADLTHKTVVVVNAPYPFLFLGLPILRAYWDQPIPERIRLLAPGFAPLQITRTGEKTLRIKAQANNLLSPDPSRRDFKPNIAYFYHEFNSLFRPHDLPFAEGEKFELSDMSVEVIEVDSNGQPTEVQFYFDVSLDDPSLHWLQWNWEGPGFGEYSTFQVPAIGEEASTKGPFGDT